MTKRLSFLLLPLLLSAHFLPAFSGGIFYQGPIKIEVLAVQIDVQDSASLTAEYTLTNRSNQETEVVLSHAEEGATIYLGKEPLPDFVSFEPGQTRTVLLKWKPSISGENTRSISFNPSLLLDGKRNNAPVLLYTIDLLLPSGVPSIIGASLDPKDQTTETSGRVRYQWQETDLYPTTFFVKWSTLGINLKLEKSSSPTRIQEKGEKLHVSLTVTNQGEQNVNSLTLRNNYDPNFFSAGEPEENFRLSESTESDPRLYWQAEIETLAPDETRIFEYSLRFNSNSSQLHHFQLGPTGAFYDGELVGVSNGVALLSGSEYGYQSVAKPGWLSIVSRFLPYALIILILIILGLSIYLVTRFLRFRKRKS